MNGFKGFFGLLLLAFVLPLPAVAQDGARGMLTITFDDASRSQYEHGLRIAEDLGMVGTLFVISGPTDAAQRDPYSWVINWRQVRDFRDAGWEIGAHSDTHPYMTEISTAEVIRELDVSREAIEENVGIRPVTFATPYGDNNPETVDLIMERFSYHVLAFGGSEGRNVPETTDPAMISRMDVDWETPPEIYCDEMRSAAANGIWLVLMFHQFTEDDPEPWVQAVDDYEAVMSCAAELRDAGELEILTVRDAMAVIERQ